MRNSNLWGEDSAGQTPSGEVQAGASNPKIVYYTFGLLKAFLQCLHTQKREEGGVRRRIERE
jgi:hypothetical protein